ncbi:MAG: alpha/beta hydrolase [Bacteroidota bacterium]
MRYFKWFLGILALMLLIFALGPRPDTPKFEQEIPAVDVPMDNLNLFLNAVERFHKNLKPDNQARIIWADTNYEQTEYSLLYLHGFSASQEEGAAMAKSVARRYGMNLYLARLHAHGLAGEDAMLEYRADSVYFTSIAALGMAKKLGKKVIIMSTSTGGTLALKLAADHPEAVDGLICYSPNIQLFDTSGEVLVWPWGLSLAKAVSGGDYREFQADEYTQKYWTHRYRMEAVEQLVVLMDNTMTPETFQAVKAPLFLGYYFKDEENQDKVVSVPAMLDMYEQLGTEDTKKRKVAFPEAGDHVLANPRKSKSYGEVKEETFRFVEDILEISPLSIESN